MKKILLLGILTGSLFAANFNLCDSKVSLGKTYDLKWKKDSAHMYSNFSDNESCKIKTDSKNKIVKIYKHIDTLHGAVKLPEAMLGKHFKRAHFITYGENDNMKNKMIKKYIEFERFFKKSRAKIKVIETAYVDKSEYISVVTVCKQKGYNCSTDIEYGKLKKESK